MANHILERTPRIIYTGLCLVFKREMEYKINMAFDAMLRIGDLLVYLLLWTTIFSHTNQITAGWTFNEMILLFALQAFFIGMVTTFAYAAIYMNVLITQGKLDAFLTKPIISWLGLWLQGIGLQITGLITGTLALLYLVLNGYYLDPLQLLLIAPMILVAFLITNFFAMSLVTLTFWFGRLRELNSLFDSFWSFADYPTIIFNPVIRIVIAFTMPFLFVHTVPILWITKQISSGQFLAYFVIEIAIVWFLMMLFYLLWKRGLKRYDSFGG